MKVKDITTIIEDFAPLSLQETYDNSGLIVGNHNDEVSGVLICIDCIEDVVDEAISKNCSLIIAHHPIVFNGLKKLNGNNYIERTIIKAIKNNISIYASHTNLDNAYNGVNFKIAEKLGLINCKVLQPKRNLLHKIVVFCPIEHAKKVRLAMFSAGAGNIGEYDECSYNTEGYGTFKGSGKTTPYVGSTGEAHEEKETRIETIAPSYRVSNIIKNMIEAHPYEEVAYDIYPLQNTHPTTGSGIIGELSVEENSIDFLNKIKKDLKTDCIRHSSLKGRKIKKIALCGGSGSFLLNNAIAAKADIFISGDFKYHQFFDADNKIIIADIGHYESEQFTCELIYKIIIEKIPNFAVRLTENNTNPINYL